MKKNNEKYSSCFAINNSVSLRSILLVLFALLGMDRCEINFSSDVKRNFLQNVAKAFNASMCFFEASWY